MSSTTRLPRLLVELRNADGTVVKVKEMDDPREAYCCAMSEVSPDLTAVPVDETKDEYERLGSASQRT